MPKIEIAQVMDKQPGHCFGCGSAPIKDGHPIESIDLNQDYDWGNNAYLCAECVDLICDLWGRVPRKDHDALKKDYRKLSKEHAKLEERFSKHRAAVKRMTEGKKAEKELSR